MKERMELKFKGDMKSNRNPINAKSSNPIKFLFIFHLQQKGNKNNAISKAFGWLSVPNGNISMYGNIENIISK